MTLKCRNDEFFDTNYGEGRYITFIDALKIKSSHIQVDSEVRERFSMIFY